MTESLKRYGIMVSFWYFVRDMGKATQDSVIYRVKVGTSDREQTKLVLVEEFCKDCGLYFHQVSDCSDQAVRNLEKRLFQGSSSFTCRLRRTTITITELYSLIIEDSFSAFESRLAEKQGVFRFRCLIDPAFFASQSQKKNHLPLPSHSRKNLKSGSAADFNSFLIGSALLIISFLLAGFIEGKIVYGL